MKCTVTPKSFIPQYCLFILFLYWDMPFPLPEALLALSPVKSSPQHPFFASPGLEVGVIYLQHLTWFLQIVFLPPSFIKTPSFEFQLIRLCTSYLPCLPPSLTDPQFTVTCFLKIQPPAYFAFPTHFFFLFNSSSPSDLTVPTIQQSWLCLFPTILLSSLTCLWNVESMTNQDNHSLTPSPSPLTLFYSLELQVYVHFTALVGPHETGGKLSVQTGLVLNSQLLILHLCSFAMPSVLLQVNSPNSWQRLIILLCSRYLLSYLVKDITPVAWHTVLLNHASSLHLANLSHQHTNMVLLTPW